MGCSHHDGGEIERRNVSFITKNIRNDNWAAEKATVRFCSLVSLPICNRDTDVE